MFAIDMVGDEVSANDTVSFTVAFNEYPVVDLGPDATICVYNSVVLDAGNTGYTYNWWDGQVVQVTVYDTADQPGVTNAIYWVDVNNNGCITRDSITITWDFCVGINENDGNDITIVPNPTTGVFVIDFGGLTGMTSVEVIDLFGRVALSETIMLNGTEQSQYDLSSLAKGIYNIRIINGDDSRTIKVVKE
jgi:hypothetical protein